MEVSFLPFKSDRCGIETCMRLRWWLKTFLVQIRPLRDWNTYLQLRWWNGRWVQIRPLRDWNIIEAEVIAHRKKVQIRPLRDWNTSGFWYPSSWCFVQIRPLRDWNKRDVEMSCEPAMVQIRPLRDWNCRSDYPSMSKLSCSNQTVAGLKLLIIHTTNRNMNAFKSDRCGIETT